MKAKQLVATVLLSAMTTLAVAWGVIKFTDNKDFYGGQSTTEIPSNYRYADFGDANVPPGNAVDFTEASESAIPTVVHIKTKINAKKVSNNTPRGRNVDPFSDDIFEQFFGNPGMSRAQQASGSGVIISADGYIVTNNHVVDKADEVMVMLNNKKSYTAKVVGTDPAYDLAVLKIDATSLPYLVYGNSDLAKIGQWVLAIGYPLNLETTVTAGIISAKARTLQLNKDRSGSSQGGVESFIQTDAAVNQGNSGGALLSTDGKLIGINSAIASPTGYYSGYSYAIPVNIVRKVVDDIIKYGTVQRGYLGVAYSLSTGLSDEQKNQMGIPLYVDGIYVSDVPTDGGAYEAGIRKGDIVKSIANFAVSNGAEMNEILSRYKPGDKVPIVYSRNGKDVAVVVTLKNKSGNYDLVKLETGIEKLGGEFIDLDAKVAKQYGVDGGVVLKKISRAGALGSQTNIKENFVIIRVNDTVVKSLDELKNVVNKNKTLTFTGFFPGYDGLYDYRVNLN
jgi:Do/DeqQ family serine protease